QNLVPFAFRKFGDRLDRDDARILNRDVEPSKTVRHLVHQRFDRLAAGHVAISAYDGGARLALEARGRLFDFRNVGTDCDVRALTGEAACNAFPDASTGAGDENGLSFETSDLFAHVPHRWFP